MCMERIISSAYMVPELLIKTCGRSLMEAKKKRRPRQEACGIPVPIVFNLRVHLSPSLIVAYLLLVTFCLHMVIFSCRNGPIIRSIINIPVCKNR